MSNKKSQYQISQILLPVLMGLVGLAAGYFFTSLFVAEENSSTAIPKLWLLSLIPNLIIAMFSVLALHEIGHVIAGISVGFEFRMITVGVLMLEKEAGKLKFKWNKNLNTAGGLALCVPRSTNNILRNFILFTAGGPAMSLLLTFFAYALTWVFPYPAANAHIGHFVLDSYLHITAFTSLVIFVVTIIPAQAGGFYTDGGRILNLWKGGAQAQLEVILLQTTSELTSGARPQTIDAERLLEALEYDTNTPFKAYLHSFLYYHYLDKGQIDEAEIQLQEYANYLAQIPSGYQAIVWLEKSFFKAFYHADAEGARRSFEQAKIGAIIPEATTLRAEAALAFVENNPALALEKIQAALDALPKSIDQGTAKLEQDLLNSLKEKIANKP